MKQGYVSASEDLEGFSIVEEISNSSRRPEHRIQVKNATIPVKRDNDLQKIRANFAIPPVIR